jgi:N-sulfoglucosamine sulfohydrolase
LYDLDADPFEVDNLAGHPDHRETLERLRAATEDWQRATDDPWLYRDGVSVRAVRHHLDAGLRLPARFDFDCDDPGSR